MEETRRRFVRAAGVAAALGLAGCAGDSESDDASGDEGGDAESTPTETDEMAAESTPTETDGMDSENTPTETDTGGDMGDSTPEPTPTGTATSTPTPTPADTDATEATSLAVDSEGIRAWVVPEDEAGVAGDGENPTLTFETGTRYVVENRARNAHPFALRAADDTALLSQTRDGEFEDVDAVDWVDDDTTISFTVTEDLAAELDYYICTVHSSMRGDVETV